MNFSPRKKESQMDFERRKDEWTMKEFSLFVDYPFNM